MENIVEKFNYLINVELKDYTNKKKISYYEKLQKELDDVMNDKKIDLDLFEDLLRVKKKIMSKLYNLKSTLE